MGNVGGRPSSVTPSPPSITKQPPPPPRPLGVS